MARHSESALASLLLASRSVPTDERPLSAREFWSLVERVEDPARLLGCEADALEQLLGPKLAPRVAVLLDRATALALELDARAAIRGLVRSRRVVPIAVLRPWLPPYRIRTHVRLRVRQLPFLPTRKDLVSCRSPSLGASGASLRQAVATPLKEPP